MDQLSMSLFRNFYISRFISITDKKGKLYIC